MNRVWMTLCLAGAVGCATSEADDGEQEAVAAVTRPSLSSICGHVCRNSHFGLSCSDTRPTVGEVNVSALPLLEGASKAIVPGVTTADWSSTSCPNCQWSLISVTDLDTSAPVSSSHYLVASAATNVHTSTWGTSLYQINMQIYDPTDASVGVCDLHVVSVLQVGPPQ